MQDIPKHIKRKLRELAGAAHEEELRRALLPLADDFDRMRRGELSSSELTQRLVHFMDGPVDEMEKRYYDLPLPISVAYAVHTGVLSRQGIAPEVLEHLRLPLEFYRMQDETYR